MDVERKWLVDAEGNRELFQRVQKLIGKSGISWRWPSKRCGGLNTKIKLNQNALELSNVPIATIKQWTADLKNDGYCAIFLHGDRFVSMDLIESQVFGGNCAKFDPICLYFIPETASHGLQSQASY